MHPREILLGVRGLRKAFGGLVAVRDLSFDLQKGAIFGLIGPNGSGKTTVLNLITAELAPDQGSVMFRGKELVGQQSFRVCRAGIARTFQIVRMLPHMTARENVMLGCMFGSEPVNPSIAVRKADALLERVGLAGRADLQGSQLTYIDQKRAELGRALATHPQLLLLVVMIEHVMEAIRALCDHVVVMNAGEKIAEGTSDAVLSDAKVMQAYLGADDAAA